MRTSLLLFSLPLVAACTAGSGEPAASGDAGASSRSSGSFGSSASATVHVVPRDAGKDAAATTPFVPVDVVTHHNDLARSGVNPNETILTTDNVRTATFGKLLSLPVDGLIYAQPLVLSAFAIGGVTRNVVFTATAHDSVFAFDADTGELLWKASLGPSVPSTQVGPVDAALGSLNLPIEVGIVSTPVIDRAGGVLYVTTTNYHGAGVPQTMALHVLSLTSGADVVGSPIQISALIPGTGDGADVIDFAANMQTQRPGILLENGTVYLAFASHEDYSPYHGFVLAYQYDAAAGTITQTGAFTTTPDGKGGGIWAGGQGLVADRNGDIYFMVGNGTVSVTDGGHSYGESFLRLSPSLDVLDWFIVSGYAGCNVADWDVGSGGPVLLPEANLLVGGGKQGVLYVVSTTNMGHLGADVDGGVQSFQATSTPFEGFFGGPVAWNGTGTTRVYVSGVSDPIREYVLADGGLDPTPYAVSSFTTPEIPAPGAGNPVGALSLSASGASGILWAAVPLANPVQAIVPGELYALDALTLDVLWTSEQNDARDEVGNHAKFVPPTIANGKVYLATMSGAVLVYGLLPGVVQ